MSALPGASSGRSRVRSDSYEPRQTDSERSRKPGWDGRGSDQVYSSRRQAAEARSKEAFRYGTEWIRRNLPGERVTLASGAFHSLKFLLGRDPTKAEMMERLRATGRDAKTWDEAHQ